VTKKKKSWKLLPVGRKRSVDPEVTRKLEEAFSMDCTVEEACAGISDTTDYDATFTVAPPWKLGPIPVW
jgi:hypothetical protein